MLALAISSAWARGIQNTCIQDDNTSTRIRKLDTHLQFLQKDWKYIIKSEFSLHYNYGILKCADQVYEKQSGCFVLFYI